MAAEDRAGELHPLRAAAIKRDATLKSRSSADSELIEAHLLYHDLAAAPPLDLVEAHMTERGGHKHSPEDWSTRPIAHEGKDVTGFLDHLENDLRLRIWDFTPSHGQDDAFDIVEVAKTAHQSLPGSSKWLHHVPIYTKAPWSFGPFGPPSPFQPASPSEGQVGAATNGAAGNESRVRVVVLDTGVPKDYAILHPNLRGAVAANPDIEDPYEDGRYLRLDAGHGQFIASVIHGIAPEVGAISMRRPARNASNLTLGDFLIALDLWESALDASSSSMRLVVNMSLAARLSDDGAGVGLFRELNWLAEQGHDILAVVAAGNAGDDDPTFPAAWPLPNVVSVGALDATGDVAPFSSRGTWVDCWTTGAGITGAYLDGIYDHPKGYSATFSSTDPWARWSGTSFAAPRVAAAIAHRAARRPEASLLSIWETMRNENRDRHPHWRNATGGLVEESGVVIDV